MIGAATSREIRRDRLVIADVTLLYGERSGGVRTYLDEKAQFAARTGAFEHHVIVPARRERHSEGRHELRSLRLVASNGYRVPLGAGPLKETLRAIRPHVVMLHDPFWRPTGVTYAAHKLGAQVVAVHHASAAMNAAGVPGPDAVYLPFFKRVYRHAYEQVDAIMSVVDSRPCSGREPTFPLRLGLHPAFRPGPGIRRDHVLYAGRMAWEKGVFDLLEAAALSTRKWKLWLVGDGPAQRAIRNRVTRLGLTSRVSFRPYTKDRAALARMYREAACVVMPGPHETFGLVALEAAASGGRVVAADSAPSARIAAPLVHTFARQDPDDLARTIEEAVDTEPSLAAAAELADRLAWRRVFTAELHDLAKVL